MLLLRAVLCFSRSSHPCGLIDEDFAELGGSDRSPLYRPNLRYSVIPKTANPIGAIIDFIEEKRNGQSGIIYCLSQSVRAFSLTLFDSR